MGMVPETKTFKNGKETAAVNQEVKKRDDIKKEQFNTATTDINQGCEIVSVAEEELHEVGYMQSTLPKEISTKKMIVNRVVTP